MKQRLVSLVIAAMLLCMAAVPAAVAQTVQPDFSEHVAVEYMGWSNNGLDGSDSVYKKIEELFNMDLTYTSVPNGDYETFANQRFASGDIPVMFKTMVPNVSSMEIYRQFKEDGAIINISEYVDKYGFENLKARLNEDWAQPMREDDGFYMVPNKLGPAMQAMFVRQDWVDKLGLAAPKTYDEFKTYLKAMVDADPDGNGATGLTVVGVAGLEHVISAFTGKSGDWVFSNGEWVHKSLAEGFKEGVAYCADLYKEGLLDAEFAMMNNTTIQEKLTSGKAAALILNGTAAWWNPMETALKAYKPDGVLGALSEWPAGPAGEIKQGGAYFFGAVHISSAATEAQRVRALAFMDWSLTQDCLDLFFYGIEGEQYTVVNGEKVIDAEAKKAITFGRDLYLFYDLINNTSQYNYLTIQPLIDNFHWLAGHTALNEVVGLSNEVTAEVSASIADVYNTWMVDFVTGRADVNTQWDEYVAELKAAGSDRYAAEVVKYMAK